MNCTPIATRRRVTALALVAALCHAGCMSWRAVPLDGIDADDPVRVTTVSGRQFPLYRPSVRGDSMVVGLASPADSVRVSVALDSVVAIERYEANPAGTVQVIALMGVLGLTIIVLSLPRHIT